DALDYSFSRADGPGGQNVNKRSTRAQLRVSIRSIIFDERAKLRLRRSAGSLLVGDDELLITSAEHRSQRMNAKACFERLAALVRAACVEPKVRKKTKPSRASTAKRLDAKKRASNIKKLRRRPEP
ncbi:MAG: alternative ribosome rescue aminoacyl-tRNA hydrolase ArfB, partial [Planctomycetota bacterium]